VLIALPVRHLAVRMRAHAHTHTHTHAHTHTHTHTQELSTDNERLRLTASSARETAARQGEELSRLQREHARMDAALVGRMLRSHSSLHFLGLLAAASCPQALHTHVHRPPGTGGCRV
jgi:hypothetical protein